MIFFCKNIIFLYLCPIFLATYMKNNTSLKLEKELLSRLNNGDRKAFNYIFYKYYKPLCAYAYRFIGLSDAEETVQDLLLWLWQNHETFMIRSTLSSYLFHSVYLRCLSRIKQNTVKKRAETLYWQRYYKEMPYNIEEFQADELLQRIHKAIEHLPESYRKAFVMHKFENCSYKEIAEKMNVSSKTVDYRIQQALKLLREDLKEYFPILLLICVI